MLRLLRRVLSDEASVADVLRSALRAAGAEAVPADARALVMFAHQHLSEPLSAQIGPEVTEAFLDRLGTELATLALSPASADPIDLRARPAPSVAGPPAGEAKPKATSSRRMKAVVASVPRESVRGERPAVVLVHADRVLRASLARALANARFDVVAVDALDLSRALEEHPERRVLVTDLSEATLGGGLIETLSEHPDVSVVAWTALDPSAAQAILRRRDADVVLPTGATEIEVVAAARRLAER
jgi:hypothetical protein